jgi:hypothetical protein
MSCHPQKGYCRAQPTPFPPIVRGVQAAVKNGCSSAAVLPTISGLATAARCSLQALLTLKISCVRAAILSRMSRFLYLLTLLALAHSIGFKRFACIYLSLNDWGNLSIHVSFITTIRDKSHYPRRTPGGRFSLRRTYSMSPAGISLDQDAAADQRRPVGCARRYGRRRPCSLAR